MKPEILNNPTDICQRLRGIYTVPVNDGAGLLDGKDTFTRQFETAPIQHEAANEIEKLRQLISHCWVHSGYPQCGYLQMTTEQKQMYCEIIGAQFTPLSPKFQEPAEDNPS